MKGGQRNREWHGQRALFCFFRGVGQESSEEEVREWPCENQAEYHSKQEEEYVQSPEVYTSLVCSRSSKKKTYEAGMG